MTWKRAIPLADLDHKPFVFKSRPKQIAIFKVNDQVFAIDNRCPHEGYPLVDGEVDAERCLLTCAWHNWKFRLGSGTCVLGGDHVRSYPTEIRSGEVWVDLSELPLDETERSVVAGLKTAFEQQDFGRICREIARLHFFQLDPLDHACLCGRSGLVVAVWRISR